MSWQQADIQALGKIAVLMGGVAAEREVSLKSGGEVFFALEAVGADVELFDVQSIQEIETAVKEKDVVFNAIHGRWGEDGTVQGILDSLGVAYTGSGMAASAIAMDKLRTKWLWQGLGLPTPKFIYVSDFMPLDEDNYVLGFPVIVKPIHEGSSIGMRKAHTMAELKEAVAFAQQFDSEILIEQWITGREFTCAVLGEQTLPIIELKTDHDFYDFDAKYQSNDTQYICPAELAEDKQQKMSQLVLSAFRAVGASGWGRVDLMMDEKGQAWLIELNTVPGMTDHSLVPMAAKAAGSSFVELILNILLLAKGKSA